MLLASVFSKVIQLYICAVLSCSVVSNSLLSHGLEPTRLFYPWGFSRQEYRSRLPCPPPGDLPNPETEPRSPTLQADSLPAEPPGKPNSSLKELLKDYLQEKENNRRRSEL